MTRPEETIVQKKKDRHTKHWEWAVYALVEYGECKTEEEAFGHIHAVKHYIEEEAGA